MRIVVSGGTGLIGSAFTRQMLDQGHAVVILSRHPQAGPALRGAEMVAWDGNSVGPWAAEIARADAVVNLAGENIGGKRWTPDHLARVRSSRLQAGKTLVEAIRQASRRPGVFVQSSAVGYYGPSDEQILDENAPAGQDTLARICQDWEGVSQAVEGLGVRRVVIRTGIVLSRKTGALPPMVLQFRLFAGGPLGSGRQWLPWIHLQDEIGAIAFLAQNESAHGVYNLCAPEPLTNADFGRVLGKVLRRPYWMPAPAFALKLLLGEMSTLVLDGQRAVPSRLLAENFPFRYPQAEGALRAIFEA